MPQHTILGSGIVGLMCAHYLSEAGYQVTVIDRVSPGDRAQASYGNAGVLAIGSIMPLGDPSIIWQGLKMLTRNDASLSMPWRYRTKLIPWLLKLLRESTQARSDANARAIAELNKLADQCWRNVICDLSLQAHIRDSGWLKVFETDSAMAVMQNQLPMLEEFGLGFTPLTQDELRQLEPSLSHRFRHGVLQTQSQSIHQPDLLVKELMQQLKARGVSFVNANVQQITPQKNGFELTSEGFPHHCKSLTVCCGAWSQRLLATIQDNFPLETERGYHLMFDHKSELSRSVMHMEEHIVLTPMTDGLRMTSGVEMAGLDAPPNYRNIRKKIARASAMLNDVTLTEQSHWLGFRPSLPDSNPVIGHHPKHPGLTLAFGHGHLGMTQSAATGHLISQLIQNKPTQIPMSPYLPDRFM